MTFEDTQLVRRIIPSTLVLATLMSATPSMAYGEVGGSTPTSKRPLTPADVLRWQEIKAPQLSNDGRWVAYTLQGAQSANGTRGQREVVVRATSGAVEYRFPLGRVAGDVSAWTLQFEASAPVAFTADARFLLFTTFEDLQPQDGPRQAGAPGRQRTSLAIVRLADGHLTKVPGVTTFKLPQHSGDWVSYVRQESARGDAKREALQVHTMVLRKLASGREIVLPEVTALEFNATGTHVAYAVTSAQPERSGVYLRRLSDGTTTTVLAGAGSYRGLAINERTGRLAFLSDRDEQASPKPRHSIYLARLEGSPAEPAVQAATLPEGMVVSAKDGLRFTPRGDALTFMLAPAAAQARPAVASNGAKFELWHWQSSASLPNGETPLTPYPWSVSAWHFAENTYLSVYHIDKRKWTRLETPGIREVLLSDDGRRAIGFDRGSHALEPVIEAWTFDLYAIDARSGKAQRIRKHVQPSSISPAWNGFFQLSPDGRYCIFLQDDRWWSYEFASGEFVSFTGPDNGTVGEGIGQARKWHGIAGWTAGDDSILLHDAFDLWAYDPDGQRAPRRLTDGRERGRIYRALHESSGGAMGVSAAEVVRQRQSPHSGWQVDLSRPLLLEAQEVATGEVGLWQLDPKPQAVPRPVLRVPGKRVTARAQALDAPQVLVTVEAFQVYPDLWAGRDLAHLTRLSEANPQQHEYLWGSEELTAFQSESGATLRGRLYKPEPFDPQRRYPLVVFVYQTHALDMMRRYGAPALQGGAYTGDDPLPTQLTSKGYVALQPDIATITGAPMKSAVDAIVPAVQAMIDTGYIDPARIALTGHSFGGGETLYTLTQAPNVFRCAVASAGFSNLISSYGSQSFGGIQPAFLERGQLAMGVSPWADPYRYLQNSAILYADRVATPLLMLHNDQDHAVAYAEGFQFFAALRRLGKAVWLYNYPGESHVLEKHANIADWQQRMDAFLDHCLKEAPEPEWMKWPGVPSPFV